MKTIIKPDTRQKIELLDNLAQLDQEGEPVLTSRQQKQQNYLNGSLCYVQRPDGPLRILRTTQTSACERNCYYCPFRAGRNSTVRISFSPDELACEFNKMHQSGLVKGLFLSSGISGGGIKTQDKMLDTATIIRKKYNYRGYIHLKLMPGAEQAQVMQAMRLADRISINLEGANTQRLASLAPQKNLLSELLPVMQWTYKLAQSKTQLLKPPSLVTQFVVGPAGESDKELLTGVTWLYSRVGLARAYYSPFSPIADTPLAHHAPTNTIRTHRLYQADWLLRFYGFKLEELPFSNSGSLPNNIDPKLAWAKQHLSQQLVEVNKASYNQLLRVPGIGPKTATAIVTARRQSIFNHLSDLQALGTITHRAAPFILLNGRRPPYQLPFKF